LRGPLAFVGELPFSVCAQTAALDPGCGRFLQSIALPGERARPKLAFLSRNAESIHRMSRRYVNQLVHGDSVDEAFLVADKQLRANRQGNLYLHLELRDKTGTVGARLWNASENLARLFEPGDYLHVRGKTQVFQGSLQIILNHLEVVDPSRIEPDDFLPQSVHNVGKLMTRLKEVLRAMKNPELRGLVECFLADDDFVTRFTAAPAGIKNHHAYQGGLVEHVVALLNIADRISDLYPELDRDLLLTGIFLHDIGKVEELTYDRAFAYSDSGQLVGHLVIGVEMLRDKAEQFEKLMGEPFPAELLLRLKHMIVSHHGSYEFGSPKLPMTLEAVALHYLDNLDAKINTFSREIRDDPSRDSTWTPFQQSLGRRLYKGPVQAALAGSEDCTAP
jgi:3'-5' exoribonuclease